MERNHRSVDRFTEHIVALQQLYSWIENTEMRIKPTQLRKETHKKNTNKNTENTHKKTRKTHYSKALDIATRCHPCARTPVS